MDKNNIAPEYRIPASPFVFEMGTIRALPTHPDRVLPFWVFAIMTQGKMPIQIGSDCAVVQTGQYFLLPPGIRHFGTERTPFDTVWIHFTRPAKGKSASGLADLALPAYGPVPPEINYLAWGNFLKHNLATGTMSIDALGVQFLAMIGQIVAARRTQQMHASPGASLARRTLELLLRCYQEPITTDWLSAKLGYSYGHIEREFRRHHSATIRQKLAQIRIDEAATSILMGKTLHEAAHDTGFSDYYYFIRVFTKLKGISPGRFAANQRTG